MFLWEEKLRLFKLPKRLLLFIYQLIKSQNTQVVSSKSHSYSVSLTFVRQTNVVTFSIMTLFSKLNIQICIRVYDNV